MRYVAFAAVAAVRSGPATLYAGRYELYVALGVGTLVGLGAKYTLDRHWVFGAGADSLIGHVGTLGLYSLTGVLTTGLFWAIELAFVALGDAPWLRYAGAAVGLAVGYTAKYRLDQRYVFRVPAT